MRFEKLHDYIPFVKGGKMHSLSATIYPGVDISMPGRHQDDTTPIGGDAVVLISDEWADWVRHPFTHTDIFVDIETKMKSKPKLTQDLMECYLLTLQGFDPASFDLNRNGLDGIHQQTLLYATQVLSVIEHRRYKQYEDRFGGRYLPFRFAAGIAQGNWSAADASARQKMGRPGVEWLERQYGRPEITERLMSA